jgi:ATP-dependent Lhr-like helicase
VLVFLLDEHQVVKPNEIGTVEAIKSHAAELGIKVHHVPLDGQFRCGGSRKYEDWVSRARDSAIDTVQPGDTVITRTADDVRWWTWAGYRTNATLIASLSNVTDSSQRTDDFSVRLRRDITPNIWKSALDGIDERLCLPRVDGDALDGLKFSAALPRHLAEATLSARIADLEGARLVVGRGVRFSVIS